VCILYNQRDETYTIFFIIISVLHVSAGFSAHHQELIKLYVQPWVLSCFPTVYRWCGWIGRAYKTVCAALGIVMLSCCLPLVWMCWNCSQFQPTHTSGRQQESMTISKDAHTVI
jgi:hypothetical protein